MPTKTSRRPKQLSLPEPCTWGGRRAGAGRPRTRVERGVPHVTRPAHSAHHPMHVTLRGRRDLPSLRSAVFGAVRDALRCASKDGFRVIHFSVQRDHVHLIVAGADRRRVIRGIQGLVIRLALAVNRIAKRCGSVWDDRYHARELRTPREVRNALCYVLNNARHHAAELGTAVAADWCDPYSSAAWFTGWSAPLAIARTDSRTTNPCVPARTWLLSVGWRRHGLLDLAATPGRTCARPASMVIWNDDLPAGETCPESTAPDESQTEAHRWTQ